MVKAAVGARLQDVAYRLRNLRLRRRKRSSGTQAGALWLRRACVALSGVLQSKKLRAYVALSGVLVVCLAYLWPSPCCSRFGLTCFGCVGQLLVSSGMSLISAGQLLVSYRQPWVSSQLLMASFVRSAFGFV